jgi:hypothetical protein
MVTTTTVYGFQKPTVAGDEDDWGGYLNNNIDKYESILTGNTTITSLVITTADINGGTLDNVVIGGSTAAAVTGTTITGTSFVSSGDMTFGDNDKAIFGAGSDLSIFHDGSNSYISDQGIGGLKVLNDSWFYINNAADTANKAIFKTGGEVELYYNGNQKFETTNTGIDVTGNIVVSGTVDGRDVATDGLKLDGIESNATADQTKSDIDALNINADTVDSLHASSFLRSDAADSGTGSITLTTGANPPMTLVSDDFGEQLTVKRNHASNSAGINFQNTSGSQGTFFLDSTGPKWNNGSTSFKIWHEANDGSGSGLNADLLDGVQGSSYLRSDTDDTFTGTLTLSGNLNASSNSVTALVINGNSYVYTPIIYLNDTIYHTDDTNTYINFATDEIRLTAGGSQEVTINTTGVRLGDTGNGYFQPVSGDYGSIQIDGGAHNSWEGYSIGGNWVFMSDNTNAGIYNDMDNEWAVWCGRNAEVELYHNGSVKLETTSSGVDIQGDINAVNNVYVAGAVYHEGDTNTYVSFGTDIIYLTAGGNNNFTIGNGYTNINQPTYNYSVYYEDYDALSGTSVTVNCDTAQAFALSMTGNTTFTFNSTSSGWATGFILELTGNGSTVTWPNSVKWAGGTAPDAPASGETDILVFYTKDGGTNWYGALSIDAAA